MKIDRDTLYLIKAIGYRILSILITFIILYILSENISMSILATALIAIIGTIGYLIYDRIWETHIVEIKRTLKDDRKPPYFPDTVRAYIDIVRPLTFFGAFIVGVLVVLLYSLYYAIPFEVVHAIGAGLVLGLLQGSGQVLNQSLHEEVMIDIINKKDYRPVPSGLISETNGKIYAFTLLIIGILIAFGISQLFGLYSIIIGGFATLYTVPPLRIKRIFLINNLWQGIARGLLPIIAVWSLSPYPYDIFPLVLGTLIAIWTTGAQTTKDFTDIEGDSLLFINTLPVVLGSSKALDIMTVIMILPFFALLVLFYYNILPPFLLSLLILIIPTLYIRKCIKKGVVDEYLENNRGWVLFYITLVLFYLVPIVCLIIKKYWM